MNIIVCVKQVPNPENANFNEKSNTVFREGTKMMINPLDMNAVEESLRIREKLGGKVTALSMGIPKVAELLREISSLGVDESVLLSDSAFAGADTLATAYALSKGINKIGTYDLIICGKQSIDGDTAQVGPSLAEKLGIPNITCVRKIVEITNGRIRCERLTDDGCEVVEMRLPGLISVVRGINEPRLPSLKGIVKAKKVEIPIWNAKDVDADINLCGFCGSPTQVLESFIPERKVNGRMIYGSPEEQASVLVEEIMRLL